MIDQRTGNGPVTTGVEGRQENPDRQGSQSDKAPQFSSISLPKGGGAVRGIGEKFAANPVTGTGALDALSLDADYRQAINSLFTQPANGVYPPEKI